MFEIWKLTLYHKHANKNIILIVQTVKFNCKFDFQPLRELKMCQYIIGSVRAPRYLIIIYNFFEYFFFYGQISIIGFLSRKINSVLKWWGVIRKSIASLFKQMKTHVQCNKERQKLDPRCEINKHEHRCFHISSLQIYSRCTYNFPKTVRACVAK
jgi:hypothetical protein